MASAVNAPTIASTPARRRRWSWLLLLLMVVAVAIGAGWYWHARRVQGFWLQAQAALKAHDLDAAASHLDRFLEHQPHDAAAWFLAGRTARRRTRYRDAERCLQRCQEVGGVTEATRLEWDLLRVQQGHIDDAHMRLRMTITPKHPDALIVLEALARGYLKADRLRDAVEACEMWLTRQPDHPWPWLWRGGVLEQLGNYDQALDDYRRALDNAPQDRDVRLALGALLARSRQPIPAAKHFEFLLNQSAHDEDALLGLAACRIEQGRARDALALLDEIRADPAPARALFLRGRAALEQLDAAGAENWLAQSDRQEPNNPETLHQLILAARLQGKNAQADQVSLRLEALHKDLARLTELIRIIGNNPKDVRPWHEIGVLALRLGRTDEGVRWLFGALRVAADHRPTHLALAEHFRRQGDARADYHDKMAQAP